MKEKVQRFFGWRPSEKLVAVMAVGALLVMLLPLLRLCEYAVPWFDDYGYATYVKADFSEPCTLLDAIKGGISAAVDEWYHWEGTYSAIFLGTQVPLIWGEEWYGLGPAFIILLLTISVMVLVSVFNKEILQGDFWSGLTLQAGCAGMVVMFIYSAQRGFYWYDGGVFYVAMSAFTMLYIAAMLKLMRAEKKKVVWWIILCILTGIVVGGGNYVTTLQGMLLTCSFLALVIWKKRQVIKRFLLLTAVYAVGFGMNVLAPGNSSRGEYYVGWGMSPVWAVLYSFVEAAKRFFELTGLRTLLVLILLAPFMWQIVKRTRFRFQYPGLVLAWSVCLYAATFTPALYALGSVVLARMLCTIKITLQLMLLLNEIYWLGWIYQKLQAKKKLEFDGKPYWWFYPVIGALMLLVFVNESNQAGNYSAYGAYYYVHTGEAYNFYQEYQARLAVLKSDEKNVVLTPDVWRPWFLCAGELSDNPDSDRNQMIARWYNKESVICRSAEE